MDVSQLHVLPLDLCSSHCTLAAEELSVSSLPGAPASYTAGDSLRLPSDWTTSIDMNAALKDSCFGRAEIECHGGVICRVWLARPFVTSEAGIDEVRETRFQWVSDYQTHDHTGSNAHALARTKWPAPSCVHQPRVV